jgi:NADH-quinone oxidoreductase subunit F
VKKLKSPSDVKALQKTILNEKDHSKQVVKVCCTTGCRAGGALKIIDAFKQELAGCNIEDKIEIKKTGCRGFCENGPVMAIEPDDIFYNKIEPGDVADIHVKRISLFSASR